MPLNDAMAALAYDTARAGADPGASFTLLSEAAGGLLHDPSAAQGQPQLEPRIVGGVEADTDRWVSWLWQEVLARLVAAVVCPLLQHRLGLHTPCLCAAADLCACSKYVCSLRANTTSATAYHYCGCSLISPSVVMTAAHCLANPGLSTPMVHVSAAAAQPQKPARAHPAAAAAPINPPLNTFATPSQIGRYYQQQPSDYSNVNDYDAIQCTSSVVNRGWSTSMQQNDIALCFLASASRFKPVRLGDPGVRVCAARGVGLGAAGCWC